MIPVAALLLVVLVGAGIYVAAAIGILAFTLSEGYAAFPLLAALGESAWSTSTGFTLIAVPLFILMGEILVRTGIADRMYDALNPWLSRVPGGVMHTNIAAAALFASTSGSSVATAATISTVSLPNMARYNYHPPLFLGTLAAGGTLGILIPPSINMIIYGLLAETSIGDLYLAGVIPGIVLALLFSLLVLVACLIKPAWGGTRIKLASGDRFANLVHLLPPLLLFLIVVGSIYGGVATPSEAASLGVIAALILAALRRRLTMAVLMAALEGTMRTTCMVMLIVVAAIFLTFVMSSIGLTDAIVNAVINLGLGPIEMILALVIFYLILGCFLDPLSMLIATAPVVIPVVDKLGFDLVWFGVVFMILTEAALITPPIGVNLFVVQSIRRDGPFRDLVVGTIPFLIIMLAMIGVLTAMPELALWLPKTLSPN